MKLRIVGSRKYPDLKSVAKYVESLSKDLVIITGDAAGVDRTVDQTCARLGRNPLVYRKNYDKHKHAAPFVRNARIVKDSDAVVVFWDGWSTGTQDVMERAVRARKLRWVFMGGTPPSKDFGR